MSSGYFSRNPVPSCQFYLDFKPMSLGQGRDIRIRLINVLVLVNVLVNEKNIHDFK